MTDKPIIFSGEMIRALLEGRKHQTRRVLKPQPSVPFSTINRDGSDWWTGCADTGERLETMNVLYAPGDRLWVREAWQALTEHDHLAPRDIPVGVDILHVADRPSMLWDARKRHARFMMRWMSRLTLIVTDVRVERVRDISNEEATDEGRPPQCDPREGWKWFMELWDSLHKPGFQWDDNPWICAVTFETLHANIDALDAQEVA